MHKRSLLTAAICAALLALVIAPVSAPSDAEAAPAAECLAAPNRKADEGQHWYFRTDRETNQKCWYLREHDSGTTGSVEGSAPSAEQRAAQQPSAPLDRSADAMPMNEQSQKALFRDFLRWYRERGGTQ